MILRPTKRFQRLYDSLPVKIQKAFDAKILILQQNMQHPSLRIKKIKGVKNIYEGSITMNYRFTFQYIKGGILLRNIGKHDDALGKP